MAGASHSPPRRRSRPTRPSAGNGAASESHWRRELEGFSAPTPLAALEAATERAPEAAGRPAEATLELPERATATLQAFARRHRLTLNTVVQGAWGLLLS